MGFVDAFDEIGLYLADIAASKPLTREKEVALAERIAVGDINARNELVEANLRFVVSVAKEYQNRGLTMAELIGAGNMGLLIAADRFDGTRGFKFISYAVWWIRQAIQQAIAEEGRTVRNPVNKIALLNRIAKSNERLQKAGVPNPGTQDIADDLGEQEEEIVSAIISNSPISSLDGSHPKHSGGKASDMGEEHPTLLEMLPDESSESPDDSLTREELQAGVQAVLERLDEREAFILKRYFGLDGQESMTLENIGKSMGLTRERVRQIKERALHNLRYPSKMHFFVSLIEGNETARKDALANLQRKYKETREKADVRDNARKGHSSSVVRQPRKNRAKGHRKQSPRLVQR